MMLRKGMFIGDRYEILDQVGSGGMSDVYKAKDHKLNRNVAVKVLKQEFSEDKNFVSKFRIEAQSAAGLSHPNIVSIYDVGDDNNLYYIVMELIEGITLKKYIQKKGRLSVKEATSIAIQVAQGIECAHNNHIIHRDIKPQNIIISKEGKVKVTDFGIARAVSANTINSNAMGSVHYISPEQARGGYLDEKSDIYSLGITMFEMLTGEMPFEGDSTVAIALQHIQGEMPDLKQYIEDIPISTEMIVQKCTQKKADRRYLKISSLIADLKRSLIHPDEDFVQFADMEPSDGKTVMFDPQQIKAGVIQSAPDMEEEEDSEEELEDKNDIDAVNPKIDRIIAVGGIIAGVVFLIIVVMLAWKFFKKSDDGNGVDLGEATSETLDERYTYMPDLLNKTAEEADAILEECNLGRKYTYAKSNTVKEGLICEQSEKAGTVVAKNTTILLTISQGADKFIASDYSGQNLDDVLAELKQLGLTPDVKYEFNSSVETNKVISSSPVGTEVQYGDIITLVVSQGSEYSADAVVPSVIGASEADAEAKLKENGLKKGNVDYQENDSVEKGIVIDQGIKAGEKLPKDSSVNLIVSAGPQQKEVPELKNLTQKKAEAKLKAEGFESGRITEEYSDEVKAGNVISSDPGAGEKVDVGSRINLVVSKGAEPESTTPKKQKYKGTVSIPKNQINSDGILTSGKIEVTIDGVKIPMGSYGELSTWPSDTWVYTITKEVATKCKVVMTLDGQVVWSLDVPISELAD